MLTVGVLKGGFYLRRDLFASFMVVYLTNTNPVHFANSCAAASYEPCLLLLAFFQALLLVWFVVCFYPAHSLWKFLARDQSKPLQWQYEILNLLHHQGTPVASDFNCHIGTLLELVRRIVILFMLFSRCIWGMCKRPLRALDFPLRAAITLRNRRAFTGSNCLS